MTPNMFFKSSLQVRREKVSLPSFLLGAGTGLIFLVAGLSLFFNSRAQNATLEDTLLLLLFPLIGLILFVLVTWSYVRSILRTREIAALLSTGMRVEGVLTDIKMRRNNKRETFHLVVTAPDPYGEVREYDSDQLLGIPAGLAGADLKEYPVPIDVFINQEDFSKYYVDLADIPSLTPERIKDLVQIGKEKFGDTNQAR